MSPALTKVEDRSIGGFTAAPSARCGRPVSTTRVSGAKSDEAAGSDEAADEVEGSGCVMSPIYAPLHHTNSAVA